jgi:predicted RNase H-like HicB family nuclease
MAASEGPDFEFAYAVTIQPQEDGAGFVARVPDLPGCICVGRTAQDALASVAGAIAAWIKQAKAAGRPVPGPSRPKGPPAPPPDLPALLNKLFDTYHLLALELGGFDRLHRTLRELAQHPPPYTDAAAFWQHLAERINQACQQIETMRAMLPSDMRIK